MNLLDINKNTVITATYDGLHWDITIYRRIAHIIYPYIKQYRKNYIKGYIIHNRFKTRTMKGGEIHG